MEITYNLGDTFGPGSSDVENAQALRTLLDTLVTLNRAYLRTHSVPPLYRSGVRYARTRRWETIPALYKRGMGDCKSLTAALVAEYLEQGIPASAVFRFHPKPDGTRDFHILVQTPRGFEDPSRKLGMGNEKNAFSRRLVDFP